MCFPYSCTPAPGNAYNNFPSLPRVMYRSRIRAGWSLFNLPPDFSLWIVVYTPSKVAPLIRLESIGFGNAAFISMGGRQAHGNSELGQ